MRKIVFLIFLSAINFKVFAQLNPTDACGTTVQSLTVGAACVNNGYTLPGTYANGGGPAASCGTAGNDRDDGWYRFVATSTSTTIDVRGDRAMAVAVYTGSCGTGEIICSEVAANTNLTLTFATTIGTTYYVQIHRRGGKNTASMAGQICVYQSLTAGAGCLAGTLYPAATFSPSCSGVAETITACAEPGEYSVVSVSAGTTYTFASSNAGDYITIANLAGTGTYIAGTTPLVWVATVTGDIRYYIHRNSSCGTNTTCRTRTILCGTAGPPSGNQDCSARTQVCSDNAFAGNSSGFSSQELNATNRGCLFTEHQSSWYLFQIQTSGTVSLNITTAIDYDFAIWGPNLTCTTLANPIRCSFSGLYGNTGLGNGATDLHDGDLNGANGDLDAWVAPMAVTAGQTYIMLIDNFTSNSTSFTLDWTMAGGASLNCTPFNIKNEPEFQVTLKGNIIKQKEETRVEKSYDGKSFLFLTQEKEFLDSKDVFNKIIYYRVNNILYSVLNSYTVTIIKRVNILGYEVSEDYQGVVITFYSNGNVIKEYKQINK